MTYFFNQFHFFYLSSSKYDFPTLIKMGGVPIDPITKQRLNISQLNLTFDENKNDIRTIQMNIINNYSKINRNLEDETETNEENREDTQNEETESPQNEENQNSNEDIGDHNIVDFSKHPILLDFTFMDALSFAAVISATDAVAALTFIHEDTEPKLFAILFGEGVVNDAVCIVIYKILTDFQKEGGEFNFSSVLGMIKTFISLFAWSFLIGLGMGIIGSSILKSLKKYSIGRQAECALICLFAYLSYILSEELELSPIIALLFNGIFNSQKT